MEVWKRKAVRVLMVVVLCVLTGCISYSIGNNKGYVDGWTEGKATERLYTQFVDDLIKGEHLEDEDIENEISMSYIMYTYNKRPTKEQAKHLFDLLYNYVFWGVKARELSD